MMRHAQTPSPPLSSALGLAPCTLEWKEVNDTTRLSLDARECLRTSMIARERRPVAVEGRERGHGVLERNRASGISSDRIAAMHTLAPAPAHTPTHTPSYFATALVSRQPMTCLSSLASFHGRPDAISIQSSSWFPRTLSSTPPRHDCTPRHPCRNTTPHDTPRHATPCYATRLSCHARALTRPRDKAVAYCVCGTLTSGRH